jgi:acyl-CoA thioester hydrolase
MTRDAEYTPLEKTRLEDFPSRTFDKLRYVDTDRQGHVNNAVFASMLETGRTEILYNPGAPLAAPGCSFVIARLTLDFRSQLTWPGRVDIGTRVASVGRSSITLEQGLFQEGVCAATATTVIVHVNDTTRRSEPLHGPATSALELLRR